MVTEALKLDGAARLELIYLDEPRELAYWANLLDCSEDELQKIVGMVGPHAIDVRRHLALVRDAERRRKRRLSVRHLFSRCVPMRRRTRHGSRHRPR